MQIWQSSSKFMGPSSVISTKISAFGDDFNINMLEMSKPQRDFSSALGLWELSFQRLSPFNASLLYHVSAEQRCDVLE